MHGCMSHDVPRMHAGLPRMGSRQHAWIPREQVQAVAAFGRRRPFSWSAMRARGWFDARSARLEIADAR